MDYNANLEIGEKILLAFRKNPSRTADAVNFARSLREGGESAVLVLLLLPLGGKQSPHPALRLVMAPIPKE